METRIKQCPPGYFRNSDGECDLITYDEQPDEPIRKRCPNGTKRNKSGNCVKNTSKTSPKSSTRKKRPVKEKSPNYFTLEEATDETHTLLIMNPSIQVRKPTILHLSRFLNNSNPSELRMRNGEAMLPFENYPDDKGILLYLFREIMELAINRTRDSKKKVVSIKIIEQVIENDDQLRELFA